MKYRKRTKPINVEKRERESSVSPTSGGASARVLASVAHLFPVKSRISAVGFDLPIPPIC